MKKYFTLIIILFLISCSSFKPVYLIGQTEDVIFILDSIQKVDNINIPDTSKWLKTTIITNRGMLTSKLFYLKKDKREYIITLISQNSVEHYKYRIE